MKNKFFHLLTLTHKIFFSEIFQKLISEQALFFLLKKLAITVPNSLNYFGHGMKYVYSDEIACSNQTTILVTGCILALIDKNYVIEECLP